MSDSVIAIWCLSMHRLAAVHGSMSTLTSHIHQTSEQHVEERESRIDRDMRDQAAVKTWSEEHSPFMEVRQLISIANGITASEESMVNCDEVVCAKIQQSLDDVQFTYCKNKT